jgi:hypothetical protein
MCFHKLLLLFALLIMHGNEICVLTIKEIALVIIYCR